MNPMHYVTVEHIECLSDAVVFTIDLNTHNHLKDSAVVEASMNLYMSMYPRVEEWRAYAGGGKLSITVVGKYTRPEGI